jgi:hypothetical protein
MGLNYFGLSYELAFEISPILLVDGIAANIPGGVLPIAVFTEGLSISGGVLQGNIGSNPSTRFIPQAGTTLVQQDIASLNFYNQAAAANSVVSKPNRILMQMIRPISTALMNGYRSKLMTFTALKMALDLHNESGGSYTVLTPGFIYTGCLMKSMLDNSSLSGQNKQSQYSWLLEFEQPLLSISQTDTKLGTLMSKFESGMPSSGGLSWSGIKQAFAQEF